MAQIPNTGVIHFDDVIRILSEHGGQGMTSGDAASLALPSCNVRMESKYKMVPFAEHFPALEAEWWKGTDKLCGCTPKDISGIQMSDIPALYDGKRNGWEYNPPRGNAYNEPYRINDYKGYNTDAKPMFTQIIAPTTVSELDTEVVVAVKPLSDDGYSLLISDFDDLKNYHLGVLLYAETGCHIVTSDSPVGEHSEVVFSPSGYEFKDRETYQLYPILSRNHLSLQEVEGFLATGSPIVTVPGVRFATMTISTVQFLFNDPTAPDVQHTFAFKGYYDNSDGTRTYYVEFRVAVKHNSENQITISAGEAFLRYRENGTLVPNASLEFIDTQQPIQANSWIGIGEGQIEISQGVWEQELDIYIGLNGNTSGQYEYGENFNVQEYV